jgi:hypothetical protein
MAGGSEPPADEQQVRMCTGGQWPCPALPLCNLQHELRWILLGVHSYRSAP